MPTIATTVYDNGKIRAVTVYCTPEEYKQYCMNYDVNEVLFSATLVREYLKEKDCDTTILKEHLERVSAGEYAQWLTARTITLIALKDTLEITYNLPYTEFVDWYAEKIKSL